MRFWQSVRFKIVIGFFLILSPVVLFLIYNNLYATKIVREQISMHYNNLMSVQVETNDAILKEMNYYLQRMKVNNDQDILAIQTLPSDLSEYTLAMTRIRNRFALDTGYYNKVDTFFIYSEKDKFPVIATNSTTKTLELDAVLNEYMSRIGPSDPLSETQQWEILAIPGAYQYLIKTVDLGFGVFVGALVQIDSLNEVMKNFDVGPEGAVYMIDSRGSVKSSGELPEVQQDVAFRQAVLEVNKGFKTLPWSGEKYHVLTQASEFSDLHYVIVTTDSYILKNLPFFQRMLYFWIPLTAVGALTIYLIVLQQYMFKPLLRLVRGMRKLGQGQFDTRLPIYPDGGEFTFLSATFNQMATQIEELKIDVYEEQLRVQRAEYKHLQIQINPHFYMNSLNIIYNLSALKDYKSVQKMSLHLADYFRFLMLGHRTVVSLEDEIKHITHYLEIQKIRYVTKMDYAIDVKKHHLSNEISPLMLQPFIENSIIHGFNRRVQDGSMFCVEIYSEDDEEDPEQYIVISIRDNGSGYPEEIMKELNAGTGGYRNEEQHVGIWNILRRFKMLYAGKGTIRFSNSQAGGAVTTIRLPKERIKALDE